MTFIFRYKTHGEHHNSIISGLTNGKKKKLKKKKSNSTTPNKHGRGITTRRRNEKNSEQIEEDDETSDDDDDDESEPMDFERAFGSVSDVLKIEHKDMHENNGIIDGLNISAGDSYFDFSNKIDLKTYTQPVLVSSTINLNPLAAVILFFNKNSFKFFFLVLVI